MLHIHHNESRPSRVTVAFEHSAISFMMSKILCCWSSGIMWFRPEAIGAACSRRSIGIGGHLAMPPLPHHRAYGSVPRRFGGLSTR